MIFATILGILFRRYDFHETNVVVIYIFSVLVIARFTKGYLYGIVSSVMALLLFNWFFTEPYFTLKVNDMTYFITFAIMMFTSIVTSTLTTKVKQSALEAMERERESNALYQMTNHMTDAENEDAIARVTVKVTSEMLNCNTSYIIFEENGYPEKSFLQRKSDGNIIRRELYDGDEVCRRILQLHKEVDITETQYYYPIYGKEKILSVLCIPSETGREMSESQTRMVHSIIESASLAIERLRSIQAQMKSRDEIAQERYRGNLLRAISHDIRTPLSSIMGSSEMLMASTRRNDPKYEIEKNIYQDAQWLHGLVENILNLTKLQDGNLSLNKQSEVVEEVVGGTLSILEKRLPHRDIAVEMPENVVMVPMDARLISQVLINLLENADKHTPAEEEIKIIVREGNDEVIIAVEDHGCGIPESDLPRVFEMFYTTCKKSSDSKRGVGLGLAICQSIVEAHGGNILVIFFSYISGLSPPAKISVVITGSLHHSHPSGTSNGISSSIHFTVPSWNFS